MILSGKQKRFLRGLGAKLKAQVHVGQGGITENVTAELDLMLSKHELTKVKLVGVNGGDRKQVALDLAAASKSELVQVLGSSVLLYRCNPQNIQIRLPR